MTDISAIGPKEFLHFIPRTRNTHCSAHAYTPILQQETRSCSLGALAMWHHIPCCMQRALARPNPKTGSRSTKEMMCSIVLLVTNLLPIKTIDVMRLRHNMYVRKVRLQDFSHLEWQNWTLNNTLVEVSCRIFARSRAGSSNLIRIIVTWQQWLRH